MGTIYKRLHKYQDRNGLEVTSKGNIWWIKYYRNGKPYRESAETESYEEAKKKLKILQWNHFVPAYDKWFNGTYIKQWGEKNDTEVIVDNVGIPTLNPTAASEVSAKKGHDLFGFLWPRPVYENDVIDHREVLEECQRRYGKPIDLAVRSTLNPRTGRHHGLCDAVAHWIR